MNLKEFAHKPGLVPTPVSRALNGYPEVSGTNRERVIAGAERHSNDRVLRRKVQLFHHPDAFRRSKYQGTPR